MASGYLYRSSKTVELNIAPNEGWSNRRLARDPRISLLDSDFGMKYDEVDGVYFRLLPKTHLRRGLRPHSPENTVLVLDACLLSKHKFVMNTEENCGFCIDHDFVPAISQFSGEPGFTISDFHQLTRWCQNLDTLSAKPAETKYDPHRSEVVVLDNVSTQYILYIIY
jgi:hypothetical protein